MANTVSALKNGDSIVLGSDSYSIVSVMGGGNNSLIYRAKREGGAGSEAGTVVIRELFPFHKKGEVFRAEDRTVICAPIAQDFFDYHKRRFDEGNRITSMFLQKFLSAKAAKIQNINAFGTSYLVLDLPDCETLGEKLQREAVKELESAVGIMLGILRSLEFFHDNGILHTDVRPDNILLVRDTVMVLDLSNTHVLGNDMGNTYEFNETAGYSAPEMTLNEPGGLGFSTDLYSVCAVFYMMVTGDELRNNIFNEKQLRSRINKLPMLFCETRPAVMKTMQILAKGLHILPKKRFMNTVSMAQELSELLLRIEHRGVTRSALWEISRVIAAKSAAFDTRYIKQGLVTGDAPISVNELCAGLYAGKSFILCGERGIGKTRFMCELWRLGTDKFHANIPVVFKVPLDRYSERGGERYILNYIACQLVSSENASLTDEIADELYGFLSSDNNGKINMMLLLDGYDKAGDDTAGLVKEINGLASLPGVGIILAYEGREIHTVRFDGFISVTLEAFDEYTTAQVLAQSDLDMPLSPATVSLISKPFFAELYAKICRMRGGSVVIECADEKELSAHYTDALAAYRAKRISDEKVRERDGFIIRKLLPQIACAMAEKSTMSLNADELTDIAKGCIAHEGTDIFDGMMPEEIAVYSFDSILSGQEGLLIKRSGEYSFANDTMTYFLAGVNTKNDDEAVQTAKGTGRKYLLAAAAVIAVAAAVIVLLL